MKKKLACMLTGLIAAALVVGCGKGGQLRMGTGNVAGNYYAYGNVLGQVAEKQGDLTIATKETAGSAANLRLMKEGFLDIAIVQSDVLADAVAGKGLFEGNAYDDVRAVAGLYVEQCQIVVPADSDIASIEDLVGKRVSLGQKESGVAVVAQKILQAAGLKENMMTVKDLSFSDSADALEKGEIDAFFIMAGAPTTAVSELAKKVDIRLLSMDERTLTFMTNLFDGYTTAVVPAGTYHGIDEDIVTMGVKAVLVADRKVSSDKIEKLTDVLFASGVDIRYATAVSQEPTPEFAADNLPGAFHSGAATYYEKHSVKVETDEKTGKKHYIFGGQDQ